MKVNIVNKNHQNFASGVGTVKISESLLVQQKGYQRFAHNYDRVLNKIILDSKYRRQMVKGLELKNGDRVLVLACGTGRDFLPIIEAIGIEGEIIAVDITAEMLEQAQLKIEHNGWQNIRLVCGNVSEIEFDTKFDAVICSFAMSVIPDYKSAFKKMLKSVKSNGSIGILDVKKPRFNFLLRIVHRFILFFMPEYYEDRPVFEMMKDNLHGVDSKIFYFGYIYAAWGKHKHTPLDSDILELGIRSKK